MKRISGIFFKILFGLVLLTVIIVISVPVIFKEKIKTKVEQVINESVNATINIDDYRLGLIRHFPNLSLTLEGVSVVGIDDFENDTLTSFGSLNLVFNLASLFKKTGYEVKHVTVMEAAVHAKVLPDGSVNWDIMKDTTETETADESSEMKIRLKRIEILNSSFSYVDLSSGIEVLLDRMDFNIKGDMTASETDLAIMTKAGEVTFIMEGIKYLNRATADANINLNANLDSMRFDLRDNFLRINDLAVSFSGMVAMPGDDILTDLRFKSDQTEIKSLLSMIPSIYTQDYQNLKTSGEFSLTGSAKGIYSDADSTMPDIALDLKITDGLISYPALPEQVKNINIQSAIFIDGREMDRSAVDVYKFHMELAGNPFDMSFSLRSPISDPDLKGSMVGKIDLTALSKAVPMDSLNLEGLLDMTLSMAGRMSSIEKGQYDNFRAAGKLDISDMKVSMAGYPEIKINDAGFNFTPAYASLEKADLSVGGKSDFLISGRLENYIPYVFKDEVIKGDLSLYSKFIDLTEIMSKLATDTTETDTTALAVINIPANLDFNFRARIDEFHYGRITATGVKGDIIVRNGILSMRETGMDILGGSVLMNADYDTRDTLKPSVNVELSLASMGIKDAFNTFNTVQKLAPTAKGIGGKVNAKLSYRSLLRNDLMPVISTISGAGKLQSDEVTLVESAVYNKMKETLKLGQNYTNTFRDINVSFKLKDGRVIVSPFDTKAGNIRMNFSGDHGIDQTINYTVKTEIPRTDLGSSVNSLIDNLSAQAAVFGLTYKPSEIIRVNVRVTGTFLKPVITPFFGNSPPDSSAGIKATIKEVTRQAVGNVADEAKEKVRSQAEIQAEKLILEAEEKGKLLREEAAKTAEKVRQEGEERAQQLTREAESKGPIAKLAAQKAADAIRKEADKKAGQITIEADNQANKLLEEARVKKEELLK